MSRSAADILSRTRELYATCDSYSDEGEQISVIVGPHFPDGRETVSYRFRTAFVRPSNLYFEYREFWRGTEQVRAHGVISATAAGVEQWSSLRPDRITKTTLMAAISRFTSVSGRTASAVPHLLLEAMGSGVALPDAASARITGDVEHEGRPCFVIEGTRGLSRRPATAWIDRETFLLRRCVRRVEFDADALHVSVSRLRDYLAVKRSDKSRADLAARLDDLVGRGSAGFAAETTTVWRAQMDAAVEPAVFELARGKD